MTASMLEIHNMFPVCPRLHLDCLLCLNIGPDAPLLCSPHGEGNPNDMLVKNIEAYLEIPRSPPFWLLSRQVKLKN